MFVKKLNKSTFCYCVSIQSIAGYTMSAFSIAISLIKQYITERAENKQKQILCDAICQIKIAMKKEIVDEIEAKCLLGFCYRKIGHVKKAIRTMENIDSTNLFAVIQLACCWIELRKTENAEQCLEICNYLITTYKNLQIYTSMVHFVWTRFYEGDLQNMMKHYMACMDSLHLQREKRGDNLCFLMILDRTDMSDEMNTVAPKYVRYTFYKKENITIPLWDIGVQTLMTKHELVTTCRECNANDVICMPYGYRYYCCKSCRTTLQNDVDVEDCYKKCMKLHPTELTYPKFDKIAKWKTKTAENIDWEIIYAGLRKNKKLIHAIKKFETKQHKYEKYEKKCYEKMLCQMFCFIGFYYDEFGNYQHQSIIQALELSTKYGKMIKNYGVLMRVNSFKDNHQHVIKNYLHVIDDNYLGTSSYVLHRFADSYCGLGSVSNVLKYCKMAFMQNGHCVSDFIVEDILENVTKYANIDACNDLIVQYLDSGKITWLRHFKTGLKNNYRFWNILKRTTNTHRVIKQEIAKLPRYDEWKTDDCPVCCNDGSNMVAMDCGHWVCEACLPKLRRKCIYRCNVKN